ncbi:MAG: twin-arginine translocation signal domain-containing protein [Candidatus Korobacteraceae bacterium]
MTSAAAGAVTVNYIVQPTRILDVRGTVMENMEDVLTRPVNRRSFIKNGAIAAGAATVGAGLLSHGLAAFAQDTNASLNKGDIAILQFLAAAELIESDLWTQYAELGGIGNNPPIEVDPNQSLNNYQIALSNLDSDAPQYISSNTLDEVSHAAFLNAYLESKGADPVNLDKFRTLQGSKAGPAANIGRLTNLMQLDVDTSWYVRYRSTTNPDFGATFPQALTLNGVYAIPRTDADFDGPPFSNATSIPGNVHIQAIANVAAFHFGTIEQGGSSLYGALSQKVSSPEVLKITLGIGGDEIAHFLEWVDFAGNAVQAPVAPFTDPITGLTFPNFFSPLNPLIQPSLIFPVPCEFISSNLPHCAVIRPSDDKFAGAMAAAKGFTADGLFIGQSSEFFTVLNQLATAADAAIRQS